MKALYGYWTHFLYSCSVETYENYLKMHKELPKLHIDECLRPQLRTSASDLSGHKTSATASTLTRHHTCSDIEAYSELELKNDHNAGLRCRTSLTDTKMSEFVELWRANSMPDRYLDYYNFNRFAMCLNEMRSEYLGVIPPTDTRHRNDIRFLENGDLDAAAREKIRLEEKQRETRKNLKDEIKPKWFQLSRNPIDDEETWLFNEKYWLREYKNCPNLY
jgi:hypothetical protein